MLRSGTVVLEEAAFRLPLRFIGRGSTALSLLLWGELALASTGLTEASLHRCPYISERGLGPKLRFRVRLVVQDHSCELFVRICGQLIEGELCW